MNAEVKQLWVAALRGDEFKQGKNALRQEEHDGCYYCCLGVLCELYRRVTGKGIWQGSTFSDRTKSSMAQLPQPVRLWAGLSEGDPVIGEDTAIKLNDNGRPFTEIADRIEKYL